MQLGGQDDWWGAHQSNHLSVHRGLNGLLVPYLMYSKTRERALLDTRSQWEVMLKLFPPGDGHQGCLRGKEKWLRSQKVESKS